MLKVKKETRQMEALSREVQNSFFRWSEHSASNDHVGKSHATCHMVYMEHPMEMWFKCQSKFASHISRLYI